jgi:CHASE3 domain sensor protein
MRTATRLQAGFTLAILMLSLNLLVPLFGERWIEATHVRYEYDEKLLTRSEQLLAALTDGETGQRGFVITGRDDFLSPLYLGFSEVDRLLLELGRSADEDAELKQLLDKLQPVIAEQRSYLQGIVDVRRQEGMEAAVARISAGKGKQLMDTLRTFSGEMQTLLTVRLQVLEQRREWQQRVLIGGLVVTGLLDLLLIGLLYYFTFRTLKEGRLARHSLRNLSEQLSSGMQRLELRNREISLLSRMAGALHSINSFDECYGIIGRFAGQLFPQNAGSLTLYHPSRDVLESVAHWGGWPQEMDLFEPHSCWAIRRGQSRVTSACR